MRFLAAFLVTARLGSGCASTVGRAPPLKSYTLRMSDVIGVDPVSHEREEKSSEREVVDMTLLSIVRQLELVR